MAKRYHDSKRMRGDSNINHRPDKFNDENHHDKDEMRGAERAMYRKVGAWDGYYAGPEPRRRQEMEDSNMIHEDHMAIANLPQNVMIKPYPKTGPYMPEVLNDDISGVDAQMDYDDDKRADHFYPKKV